MVDMGLSQFQVQLLDELIDRGYDQEFERLSSYMLTTTDRGILRRRLDELSAEAARLAEAGESLDPDGPVVRALRADLEAQLRDFATLIDEAAPRLEVQGVNAAGEWVYGSSTGLTADELSNLGIMFNRPDPLAIVEALDYSGSSAWADELARYGVRTVDQVQELALRGIAQGWGPLRTARAISEAVENMPLSDANRIMRTLQLHSFRRGAAAHRAANSDVFEYAVRVAVLDSRTCLACWGRHGTRLELNEIPVDHDNGRCTSLTKIRGIPLTVPTGNDILQDLFEQERRGTISPEDLRMLTEMRRPSPFGLGGSFKALEAGAVNLSDFVGTYQSDLWGAQIFQNSLKEILGDGAKAYYLRPGGNS